MHPQNLPVQQREPLIAYPASRYPCFFACSLLHNPPGWSVLESPLAD
jgi:hypothetical protein